MDGKEYYYLMLTTSTGNERVRAGPFETSKDAEEDRWNHRDEEYLYLGSMTKKLAKEHYDYG